MPGSLEMRPRLAGVSSSEKAECQLISKEILMPKASISTSSTEMDGLMAESFSFLSKILVLKHMIDILQMLTVPCLRL